MSEENSPIVPAPQKPLSARASVLIGGVILVCVVAATLAVVGNNRPQRTERRLRESFRYDLKDLGTIDPKWLTYEQVHEIKTDMRQPRAMATAPGGRLLVAGDRAIHVYDAGGVRRSDIALSGRPYCLAVAPGGVLYVGMRDHVEVLNAEGAVQATWDRPEGTPHLTAVAVWGDNVLVADAGNRLVWRYDLSGRIKGRIGQKNAARQIPGFVLPSPYFDLAMGSDGMLRVTNPGRHRIETYTLEGRLDFSWGRPSMRVDGFCGCCNPTSFAIMPDGGYVTAEKGFVRVKLHAADGRLTDVVAGPGLFAEGTEGLDLAVDDKGRVLVLDPVRRSVRVFQRKKQEAGGERSAPVMEKQDE